MATKRARVNKTLEKAKKLISKKGKKKTTKRAYPEGQNAPQSKAYDIENDKTVPAKRTGYRFTKEGAKKLGKQPNDRPTAEEIEKYRNETFKVKGKVNKSGPTGVGDGSFRYLYIESRADKSDLNKARKLELGGMMAKGGQVHDLLSAVKEDWGEDSDFYSELEESIVGWSDRNGELTPKGKIAVKAILSNWDSLDEYGHFLEDKYAKGGEMAKGGVVFDPKEVRQFEKYVFSYYGKNGVAVDDMEEDIPATTAEVLKAVSQYLAFCNKTQKWGGGDSFDREVVHDIIAYNRNPKTTALFYESLINDMKKTPILEYGGILQPMIGGVNADPRFDIYNTTMFAEKGAELPEGDEYGKGGSMNKVGYVRAYYNDTISGGDNGYQVNLMFFRNKDDDDYFDEEFTTTDSPEEAEALAEKINKYGVSGFLPKGKYSWQDEYAKGGETKIYEVATKIKGKSGQFASSVRAKSKEDALRIFKEKHGDDKNKVIVDVYETSRKRLEHGGKTHEQGYDDREDERLAMRHGKIASKDFVGSHKRREHSRRDDARFETRNK